MTDKTPALPQVLRPQTLGELQTFAQMAARSTMVPRDYVGKPENVMVAVQMGSEIGLAPMQALQNIAVIGGRPAVWGDAMPGLCRQSPVCEDIEEYFEGEGDKLVAICIAKRVGAKPVKQMYGVDDAKKAGLWNKAGPWQQYPKRMLQMRARSFALRDAFPDVLRGLIAVEEARDIPAEAFTGVTIEAQPQAETRQEPAPPAAPAKQKRTYKELLEAIALAAKDAPTEEEVVALGETADVQLIFTHANEGVREELSQILSAAMARVRGDTPDVGPPTE